MRQKIRDSYTGTMRVWSPPKGSKVVFRLRSRSGALPLVNLLCTANSSRGSGRRVLLRKHTTSLMLMAASTVQLAYGSLAAYLLIEVPGLQHPAQPYQAAAYVSLDAAERDACRVGDSVVRQAAIDRQ